MQKILNFGKKLWKNEDGATAIEYGLLAALIALVIIGAVTLVGTTLRTKFEAVNTGLTPATTGTTGTGTTGTGG